MRTPHPVWGSSPTFAAPAPAFLCLSLISLCLHVSQGSLSCESGCLRICFPASLGLSLCLPLGLAAPGSVLAFLSLSPRFLLPSSFTISVCFSLSLSLSTFSASSVPLSLSISVASSLPCLSRLHLRLQTPGLCFLCLPGSQLMLLLHTFVSTPGRGRLGGRRSPPAEWAPPESTESPELLSPPQPHPPPILRAGICPSSPED